MTKTPMCVVLPIATQSLKGEESLPVSRDVQPVCQSGAQVFLERDVVIRKKLKFFPISPMNRSHVNQLMFSLIMHQKYESEERRDNKIKG
jgi:hypothetical protein